MFVFVILECVCGNRYVQSRKTGAPESAAVAADASASVQVTIQPNKDSENNKQAEPQAHAEPNVDADVVMHADKDTCSVYSHLLLVLSLLLFIAQGLWYVKKESGASSR